jgi:Putative zinc-finger
MMCEEVRVLLAAYRRGEWSLEEQRRVSRHLAECAACRRWETNARQVGEQLRHLPTISPPVDFRERVFAAIRADQETIAAANANNADRIAPWDSASGIHGIQPMRVTAQAERVGEIAIGGMRPHHVIFGTRTAIATVAALFALVFLLRIAPVGTSPRNTANQSIKPPPPACLQVACSPVYHLSVQPDYPTITGALADQHQIIFVAQNSSGQHMVFLKDIDAGGMPKPLLSAPVNQQIQLRALMSGYVLWSTTKSDDASTWMFYITPFTGNKITSLNAATSIPVLYHNDSVMTYKLDKIFSFAASDQSVLATATTTDNATILVRIDIPNNLQSSSTTINPEVVTVAQPYHTLKNPYLDGTTAYWIDETLDKGNATLDTIIKQTPGKSNTIVYMDSNISKFIAMGTHVAWVQQQKTDLTTNTGSDDGSIGNVFVKDSDNDTPRQIAANISLGKIALGSSGYFLWSNADITYIYHLGASTATSYAQIPSNATHYFLSNTSILWTPSGATDSALEGYKLLS